MTLPLHPLLTLTLCHFEKAALALSGAWLLTGLAGLVSADAAVDPLALADQRGRVLAHLDAIHVPEPTPPTWAQELRGRLGPPALEVDPFPGWLFHRRPGYVFHTDGGPPPVQPLHGPLADPELRELSRGVVEVRVSTPALESVVHEGYTLERQLGDGAWTAIGDHGPDAPRWTDDDLPPLGGQVRYRVRSRARLDAADPALSGREVLPFPTNQVSPPASIEVSRRVYVLIHGVEVGDPIRERPGLAQGELLRWNPAQGRFDRQWFSATEGSRAGRGDFAQLGVHVVAVWTHPEPAGGLTREVQWAKVAFARGREETIRAGVRPAGLEERRD